MSDALNPAGNPAAGGDDEVDVLVLAGQRLPAGGAWLLVTEVDGTPGGRFQAHILPGAGASAFGGDVVVRLADDTPLVSQAPPTTQIHVYAVLAGRLVPVATWAGHEPDGWPERIRPTAAFTMGVLTELEEHNAHLRGPGSVDLDQAAEQATPGFPLHSTFPGGTPGAPMMP